MSKYRAFFNEFFSEKTPLQVLQENNANDSGDSEVLFENFHENKAWFVYEGTNSITAVFEDNSRQTFKVHFHNNRLREDRDKHRTKAARKWKKLATEIFKNAGLNEVGNPIVIPWKECFDRALKHPEMKEFVDDMSATPIFESIEGPLDEMTYDDLMKSMKGYRSKSDLNRGTKTGADSRVRGAKDVWTKSLRAVSTLGKDGQEYETSMFKYQTRTGDTDPRRRHPPYQGFIRFKKPLKSPVMPTKDEMDVEVNCTCPDYKYVWAKANADHDAGVTGKDGGMKQTTQSTSQKPVNIFEEPVPEPQPDSPVAPQSAEIDKRWKFSGGNDNNNTMGKRIRNPQNTPGLCKHLIALAEYLNEKASEDPEVAPEDPTKQEPDPVAKPSKLKKRGKPINIFERIKQFALGNPTFDVPYED